MADNVLAMSSHNSQSKTILQNKEHMHGWKLGFSTFLKLVKIFISSQKEWNKMRWVWLIHFTHPYAWELSHVLWENDFCFVLFLCKERLKTTQTNLDLDKLELSKLKLKARGNPLVQTRLLLRGSPTKNSTINWDIL